MSLWITGARGLLGTTLAKRVAAITSGHEVDIADLAACRAFVRAHGAIRFIVNCAAFSQVDPAETHREEAHRANALGPETLGRLAPEIGAHLLHVSTDYVFPGAGHTPLKETDPVAPCNYYGQTKLEGEERLRAVNPAACILRTSWIFGEGGKNFVAKLFDVLQTETPLKLVDDQKGRPTYAPDLADVILRMEGVSGLYQFANSGVTSKYEFACVLRDVMQRHGIHVRCPSIEAVKSSAFASPAKRPLYSAFDTAKLEKLLAMTPRNFRTCIEEYVRDKTAQ